MYPQQTHGGYPSGPPQPPKKRKMWPWLLGGFVALMLVCGGVAVAALGLGAKAVDDQIQNGSTGLKEHVKITACRADALGMAEVGFTVVNASDRTESYWIQFGVTDAAGTRLGEAHGVVNNLAAGATAKDKAVSATGELPSKFKCVLERVN